MKRAILAGNLIVLSSFIAFSQSANPLTGAPNQIVDTEIWLSRNSLREFNESEGIVGERYFNPDWEKGSLSTLDGINLKEVELKYDLIRDMLIAKLNGTHIILKKENIKSFSIWKENELKTFKPMILDGAMKYLEVLYDENSQLFAHHSTKIIKKDQGNQAYGSGVQYDKYVYSVGLVGSKNHEQLTSIKTKKSWIVKFFLDKSKEIEVYLTQNKLDSKNEGDLIKIFRYYDSLQ